MKIKYLYHFLEFVNTIGEGHNKRTRYSAQCDDLALVHVGCRASWMYTTIQAVYLQQWGVFLQSLLQWKSGKYYTTWVCVCSLRYPVCNAHVQYGHLWPASLYNIFPHKWHDFRNKIYWTLNWSFDFYTT